MNENHHQNRNKNSKQFLYFLSIILLAGSQALNAESAANEPRLLDRFYIDAGATVHVPQNYPTFLGGLVGFGVDMKDFNITLTSKISNSLTAIPSISGLNLGVKLEYKYTIIPNTLRLLPSVYAGVSQAKGGSSSNGGSLSISGNWIEFGIGAEYFLTQDISAIFRPYYALSKLGSYPDYADISALGFDFGVRYFLGQNRRLAY